MTGICKYCGQAKEVFDAQSQQGVDEQATAECSCEKATFERRKKDAKEKVKELFGKGAGDYGFSEASKLECALIEDTALKVLQGDVRKANYDIACGDKVSIKENADGKVVINRTRKLIGSVKI